MAGFASPGGVDVGGVQVWRGEDEESRVVRIAEWALDVPTAGTVFDFAAYPVIVYGCGLGCPVEIDEKDGDGSAAKGALGGS